MSDYKKGKIYKITNDFNDEVYVGSTCDTLIKRFSSHKRGRTSEQLKHKPLYTLMNEIGHERFRIQLIEEYSCEDKYQLTQREAYFIRQIGTMNKLLPFVSDTEALEKKKIYRNSEKRKAIHKEESEIFYQQNKDKILEKNKEISKCVCGCELRKRDMPRHEKSKKHFQLMETLNNSQNNVEVLS